MYVVDVGTKAQATKIVDQAAASQRKSSRFRKETIHRLSFSDGNTLVVSAYRNLLLIARLPLLVEDAVDQLYHASKSIPREKSFRAIATQKPAAELLVWVNAPQLASTLGNFMVSHWRSPFEELLSKAGWLVFSAESKENALYLNGAQYSRSQSFIPSPVTANWSSRFSQVLPDHTAWCFAAQSLPPESNPSDDFQNISNPG